MIFPWVVFGHRCPSLAIHHTSSLLLLRRFQCCWIQHVLTSHVPLEAPVSTSHVLVVFPMVRGWRQPKWHVVLPLLKQIICHFPSWFVHDNCPKRHVVLSKRLIVYPIAQKTRNFRSSQTVDRTLTNWFTWFLSRSQFKLVPTFLGCPESKSVVIFRKFQL